MGVARLVPPHRPRVHGRNSAGGTPFSESLAAPPRMERDSSHRTSNDMLSGSEGERVLGTQLASATVPQRWGGSVCTADQSEVRSHAERLRTGARGQTRVAVVEDEALANLDVPRRVRAPKARPDPEPSAPNASAERVRNSFRPRAIAPSGPCHGPGTRPELPRSRSAVDPSSHEGDYGIPENGSAPRRTTRSAQPQHSEFPARVPDWPPDRSPTLREGLKQRQRLGFAAAQSR